MKLPPDSYEQMTWDNILVKGWFADAPMGNLMAMFWDQHPRTVDATQIRRFPVGRSSKITARRFVAAYIPALSNRLWDGATKGDVLFSLLSSTVDARRDAADKRAYDAEEAARKESLALDSTTHLQKYNQRVKRESYGRNNQWGS
jgi:hypothetical protein